ncbi:MAG: hypothetical protein IKO55_04025, partial [Kiritimatiellae bacterium]|nr:hypothetical protein [Kiritimatiellia bacterium]
MTELKLQKEDPLEEMWRIKREIADEYPTWESYVAGILAFQEEERKRGVKFVSFSPERPEGPETCAAEAPAEYDAGAKPDTDQSHLGSSAHPEDDGRIETLRAEENALFREWMED